MRLLLINKKYNLLSKLIRGALTLKEAETLKAKHVQIIFEDINYEYCIEIKDNQENSYPDNVHYYCYNENQRILERCRCK